MAVVSLMSSKLSLSTHSLINNNNNIEKKQMIKTLTLTLHNNNNYNYNSGRSYRFKPPSFSYNNFIPPTPHGYSSPHEKSANKTKNPSLKSLFTLYKEAILYQDVETISEVEAVISSFENEKTELLQKVSDMSTELSSGKEKYVRLQADFENFRKRTEKERLTIRSDAHGEVLESLLPMVDSFEKAKQSIKPESEREIKIDTSYQGIYKQFVEIMRSLRVAAVPTVGKPFNPSMHEAIGREDSLEFKEGIVTRELRRGFILGSRLLRPAMVKVSSGPGKIKVAEKTSAPAPMLDER